jgi:hypothetical protein
MSPPYHLVRTRSLRPQTTVRLFIETDEAPSAFPALQFLELWRFDLFPCTEMLSGRLGEASQTAVLSGSSAEDSYSAPKDLTGGARRFLRVAGGTPEKSDIAFIGARMAG